MTFRSAACAAVFLSVSGVAAEATPIHLTETTTASGTLGANTFTGASLNVDFSGDTSSVTGAPGFWSLSPITATVTIGGLGTASITAAAMFAFDNQGQEFAGLGGGGGSLLDTMNSAFATYDLTTAIGPITGVAFIRPDLTFATSAGGLVISTAGDVTFTATLASVPEPLSLSLLGAGLAGAAAMRRRKATVA